MWFPAISKLKILISEYSINKDSEMNFRERKWIFWLKFLKIGIIHQIYTSIFTNYPKKKIIYKLIFRYYFWLNISKNIKKYIKNYNIYKKTKLWRNKLKGFLKSLLLPNQI